MNRRNFLSLAALAVAGQAAERVFPFRVYSIPEKIAIAPDNFMPSFLWFPREFSKLSEFVAPELDWLKLHTGIWNPESFYEVNGERYPATTNGHRRASRALRAGDMLTLKALGCPHTYHQAESL